MRFGPKEITLKNGTVAVLRSPKTEDAEELIKFLRTVSSETEFLLRTPEESDIPIEKEIRWIEGNLESDSVLVICCCVDGKIVGNCDLHINQRPKTNHRAALSVAVISEFWNLGIGTAMFGVLTDTARRHGVRILELSFVGGNDRARHLYEKTGFRTVAVIPERFRLSDGSYRDEVFMQNVLK